MAVEVRFHTLFIVSLVLTVSLGSSISSDCGYRHRWRVLVSLSLSHGSHKYVRSPPLWHWLMLSTVQWTKRNPTPWNTIQPNQGTKLLEVKQTFDEKSVSLVLSSFVTEVHEPDGNATSSEC